MSDDFFDLNERDASYWPWHFVEYEIEGETHGHKVAGSTVSLFPPSVSWWRRMWRRLLRRPSRRPFLFLRFDSLDLPQDAVVTKATLNLRTWGAVDANGFWRCWTLRWKVITDE